MAIACTPDDQLPRLEASLKQAEARNRNAKAEFDAAVKTHRLRESGALEARDRLNDLKRRENTAQQTAAVKQATLDLDMRKINAKISADMVVGQSKKYDVARMAAANARIDLDSYMKSPSGWKADQERKERRRLRDEETQRLMDAVQARFEAARAERARRNEQAQAEAQRSEGKANAQTSPRRDEQRQQPPLRPNLNIKPLNPTPPKALPPAELYREWQKKINNVFTDYSTITSFPAPPAPRFACNKAACVAGKQTRALEICGCDIERAFRILKPTLSLKEERLRWHPDRFAKCAEEHRVEFQNKAVEVFQVVDRMYAAERKGN